jgi:two-component system, NarL family, sensor histidine kinase DegS
MYYSTLQRFVPKRRSLYSPHLVIVILLTVGIAAYYYSRILFGFKPDWSWQLEIFEFLNNFQGSLYIIPIVYASTIFWLRGTFITWLISIGLTLPIAIYYRPSFVSVFANFFFLCIPLLLVVFISLQLNWRNRERQTLVDREKERQIYVAQIFKAHEDERKSIAQELHDDAIQSLLVTANTIQTIIKSVPEEGGRQISELAVIARDEILRISQDLKRMALDLRPGILDNLGFAPALRWLVDRFNLEGNIAAEIVVHGEPRELPAGTDLIIFRVVHEALNNVRKHARATMVTVLLEYQPEKIKMTVTDNGKGFNVPERIGALISKEKLGLIGMQERVHSLNGRFDVQSSPRAGTKIIVEFTS